jgi:hypothetical protein
MATGPISTDELDDRIHAADAAIVALQAVVDAVKVRVTALEAAPTAEPLPGTVILPIIGYLITYDPPTPP